MYITIEVTVQEKQYPWESQRKPAKREFSFAWNEGWIKNTPFPSITPFVDALLAGALHEYNTPVEPEEVEAD